MAEKIFILDNLDCPHCASKIEQKINTLPEIDNAVFTNEQGLSLFVFLSLYER